MKIDFELVDDEIFVDIFVTRRELDLMKLGERVESDRRIDGTTVHYKITPPTLGEILHGKEERKGTSESEKSDGRMEERYPPFRL